MVENKECCQKGECATIANLQDSVSELKVAVKLTHPTAIKLLSGDVRNIEKALRELSKPIISAFTILQVPDNRIKDIEKIINKLGGKKTVNTNSPMSSGSGMKILTDLKPSKPYIKGWTKEAQKVMNWKPPNCKDCKKLAKICYHYDCRKFSEFEPKEKPCYHLWRYFNKWCQCCCEFGHGVIVSHCFKCGKYWDVEFGFWSQEEVNNQFFNEFFHDNFPPLCDTLKEIEVLTKKKNNKKNAQDTDKKSKN